MGNWKKYIKGKNKKTEDNNSYVGGMSLDKTPSERLVSKATQGQIAETDIWGVTIKGQYLDRDIKVDGADEEDLFKKYQFNAWVRACVDKIIKEVVKYRIVVKPKDPTKAEDKQIQSKMKEVQELLEDPNEKIESFDDIRRKYLKDILVYDAGSIELVYKEGKPYEIYDIKGANVSLNLDKHGNFKKDEEAYKLISQSDKNKIVAKFASNELIYMIANPIAGSAYGLSPIETLWDEIENDDEANEYNKKILKHSGLLTGVLSFANMSATKLRKNQRFWKEEVRRKGQKLIVTNNPDVKFVRLNDKQTDMQFMEFQRWLLSKIMAVYGMQPIVLGVIDANTGKLNSSEQREQFKQDAVLPLLKLEAHRLTDVLVRQGFEFDDVIITHQEPENVNEEFDLKKAEFGAKFGVITINEARSFINLQPLGGDEGKQLVSAAVSKYINDLIEKDRGRGKAEEVKRAIEDLLTEQDLSEE